MPNLSVDAIRRYGFALLSVGFAIASSLLYAYVLQERYPFFLFFIAVILAAGYGGYGPSLLALVLSWLSVDYLFLGDRTNPGPFESKSQIAFAFFASGATISMLGGLLRAARERAKSSSRELQHAFEVQNAEREWLQITLASIADAVITTDPKGRVIFLNRVASRLTGWNLDQAIGRSLKEVFRTVQGASRRTDDLPIVLDGMGIDLAHQRHLLA